MFCNACGKPLVKDDLPGKFDPKTGEKILTIYWLCCPTREVGHICRKVVRGSWWNRMKYFD